MPTAIYTYTIFDADPNQNGGGAWDTHTDVKLDAIDDDDARTHVRKVLEMSAIGLKTADGYAVGDRLYATVWDPNGTPVWDVTYTLTAEDLGITDDDLEEIDLDSDSLSAFGQLPRDAGQIVELHYAVDWEYRLLVCRRFYRGDRTTTYQVRDLDEDATEEEREFEPQNGILPQCTGEWRNAVAGK
jgi:hypothetical protein